MDVHATLLLKIHDLPLNWRGTKLLKMSEKNEIYPKRS